MGEWFDIIKFQFLMVRLKDIQQKDYVIKMIFQFLMVRLKV